MIDSVGGGPDSTVLTLVGESGARTASGQVDERICAARIENDLANANWPRSAFRVGETVGRATGPLRFDPSDRRCAVRLIDGRRELTFSDAAGMPVGTIVADALEGTAFRDTYAGDHVSRVDRLRPAVLGDRSAGGRRRSAGHGYGRVARGRRRQLCTRCGSSTSVDDSARRVQHAATATSGASASPTLRPAVPVRRNVHRVDRAAPTSRSWPTPSGRSSRAASCASGSRRRIGPRDYAERFDLVRDQRHTTRASASSTWLRSAAASGR